MNHSTYGCTHAYALCLCHHCHVNIHAFMHVLGIVCARGTRTDIVTSHNYHRIKSLAAGDSEECSLDVTFRVTER